MTVKLFYNMTNGKWLNKYFNMKLSIAKKVYFGHLAVLQDAMSSYIPIQKITSDSRVLGRNSHMNQLAFSIVTICDLQIRAVNFTLTIFTKQSNTDVSKTYTEYMEKNVAI